MTRAAPTIIVKDATPAFVVRVGAAARAHIAANGLQPADIAAIPAAAGGPKGLALIDLDRWLFGDWLRGHRSLQLFGASIGGWRMYAAGQRDAPGALARLRDAYVRQEFPIDATPARVTAIVRGFVDEVLGGTSAATLAPGRRLHMITARARGGLARMAANARAGGKRERLAFVRALVANTFGRDRLARHFERVVFSAGAQGAASPFGADDDADVDRFGWTSVALEDANLRGAMLATGTLPTIMEPVAAPAGAPAGDYWDGGLIDYHLLLPYPRLGGLVLYPHFVPHVTPGWLDNCVPWRKRLRDHPWLANTILVAPSPALLARLPNGKLPDRTDFERYGMRNAERQAHWRGAIGECERFAEGVAAWLQRPEGVPLASV